MLSNEFKTAVLDGDVLSVRIMIKDSILLDTSGKMTDEMLRYAEENQLKILEGYDGGELVLEPEKWNRDVLDLGLVELMGNFSRLRIEKLKEMAKKLYPQTTTTKPTGKVDKRISRPSPKTPKEERIAALQDIVKRANKIAELAEKAIKEENEGFMSKAENLIGPKLSKDNETIRGQSYWIVMAVQSWERNKK